MTTSKSQSEEFPYHLVIDFMTKPVQEQLKRGDVSTETLRESLASLDTVLQMLSASDAESYEQKATDSQWEEMLLHVFKDICFPILFSLHVFPDQTEPSSEKSKAFSVISRLMMKCTHHFRGPTLGTAVTQMFIPAATALEIDEKVLVDKKDASYFTAVKEPVTLFFCLELVSSVVSSQEVFSRYLENVEDKTNTSKDTVLTALFNTVFKASHSETAFCKAFILLSKLLTFFPETLQKQHVNMLWEAYCQPLEQLAFGSSHKEALWKSLYVFYCLRDYLFPLGKKNSGALSERMSNHFWLIVQSGLLSMEPADRKLAMYLFKRLVDTCRENGCDVNVANTEQTKEQSEPSLKQKEEPIFWWSPKSAKALGAVWEDFTLLIETLEEKQVHIIKPLLPKMQKLISASSCQSASGLKVFHSSWLVTVVSRCFQHESHYMSRWGAQALLTLDFQQVPLIAHGQLKFLSHDLLVYLQENKLYTRYESTELGKSSPVGEALRGFFDHLFKTLDKTQKVEYLTNVLQIVCDNSWGSIPLVFLFEGLSHISQGPVINSGHLKLIRNVLQACLTTLETMTRGAIQCFICQMVMNLLDVNSTSLWEVFDTFASVNREESLQRGTSLWDSLVRWLQTDEMLVFVKKEDIVSWILDFLQGSGEEKDSNVVFEGYKVISIARMLILTAVVTEEKSRSENSSEEHSPAEAVERSPLARVLAKISESISGVRNRPYISAGLVGRCLALLHSLSKEAGDSGDGEVDKMLSKSLGSCFTDTVHYTQYRLQTHLTQAGDLDEIKFYTDVLLSLGLHCRDVLPSLRELVTFVNNVLHSAASGADSPQDLAKLDVLSCSAVRLLSTVFKIISRSKVLQSERSAVISEIVAQVSMPLSDLPLPFSRKGVSNDSGSRAQVGRVISRFISSKWQCQGHVLQHNKSGLDGDSVSSVLEQAMEDMTIGSGSSDIAIFQALLVIAPQIAQHAPPAKIPQFLDLAWQKLMEEKKNILFWKKLESLIPLGLHKSLMQHEDPEVEEGMKEFMQKLWTLGSEKTGITFLMFDHICGHILKDDPDRRLATKWTSLLLDACAFGNVHKKGERLWLDVCAYIESLGPALAVNEITSSVSRNDLFTRVIILNWLSSLRPNVMADHVFVVQFTDTLWSQYLELAALTTYKQFSNSLSHRQKHRMVSVLLLLADFITEESSKQYMPLLWHALELECHPSVRQNLEWMVMRIIIAFPSRVSTVWDVFKQYENKRSVCLCSLFLVLSHLGVFLPVTVQAQYYIQAFTCVIPWTMAHHYNTRIFAQTTMMRMWQQCQTLGLTDVLEKFSVVQASLDFLCNNGNASNTSVKLIRNYMYCGLNPLRDYSMETIFHTLPRLASLADDEWVLPQQFVQWDKAWEDVEKHHLPLGNSSGELAQCKEGPWRMKAHVENEEDISESADGDVQKKIMPWRQMSPDQETEAELASQRRKKAEGGVIVVTSLIDKIPNLGGLCRTSEIFGVSEFVIGNLTHLGDKMFQNLSVSAQKWINITEVMRPRLIEFLEEKRLAGYTLVGVEQTANSVSLEEYQFPKKTLLLLGNEKEGIPVDIIQLLDVCVEIPQLGIIRSLNVHVCGALIVWEYTRQQMRLQQQSS